MIGFETYKLLHVFSVLLVFLALGGVIVHMINGGTKDSNRFRKTIAITHGVGLLLVLISGFGMLARLSIHWPWPGWTIGKLVIWLLVGAALAVAYRQPGRANMLWWGVVVLAGSATYLAIAKPF